MIFWNGIDRENLSQFCLPYSRARCHLLSQVALLGIILSERADMQDQFCVFARHEKTFETNFPGQLAGKVIVDQASIQVEAADIPQIVDAEKRIMQSIQRASRDADARHASID